MVLKTDGTKIYNDVNGNSDVKIYSNRFTNDAYALSNIFNIPRAVGELDCYKAVYKRWRDWNEDPIAVRNYQMDIINDSFYPKLINMIFYLQINTEIYTGETFKIIAYPFILAPGASVRLKNPYTSQQSYWTGEASVSVVAMPVTVPCAVSTSPSSRSTTDPANVSTIVSGTDKIQLLNLSSGTVDHFGIKSIGDSRKIPYITGSSTSNYQQEWWYTDYYIRSSSDVDPKRINDLTHTGYSLYQQMSACALWGDDSQSDQQKLFKDGQVGLPFCLQSYGDFFVFDKFENLSGGATSVWNTLQWGKKYLKVTTQYFGYNVSQGRPGAINPKSAPGFYNCPSVVYDSNGNVISDNVSEASKGGVDTYFRGVSIFFPLTDMNDGHLGSAYVVTEISE